MRTDGRRAARALLLVAIGIAALVVTDPAGAVIVRVHNSRFGVTPASNAPGRAYARAHEVRARSRSSFDEGPLGGRPLEFHGGPVVHSNTTHVIYWDPESQFSPATKGIVEKFFTDVAHDSGLATNVFGVNGQFTDKSGFAAYKSTFGGAKLDADPYPANGCTAPTDAEKKPYPNCFEDEQLQKELTKFIGTEGLPKGPEELYFLLLPHKVVTCLPEEVAEVEPGVFALIHPCSSNFFCAYHSAINGGTPSEILYSDIPWSLLDTLDAKGCQDDGHSKIQQPNPDNGVKEENSETRFAEVAVKYISHEWSETLTDPLGTAWFDENGLEIGDKCNGVGPDPNKDGIGYDKNAFLPVLGGEAEKGTLFDQSINGGHFYIQSEWDNAAKACRMTPLPINGASFAILPAPAVEKSPAEFKGEATDPYGHPEFSWVFGDGSEGAGQTPKHTYAAVGEYHVTMSVTDAFTGSTTSPVAKTVIVEEPPEASFTITGNRAREALKFNGAASKDPDGKIERYRWEFGDGVTQEGPAAEVTHEYAQAGAYTVTLTVEDSSKVTASKSEEQRVIDAPTVATLGASSVGQTSATLNATVNPNAAVVEECKFEYGTSVFYEASVPCSTLPGGGTSAVGVPATISGLAAGATYHFRVVATNVVGKREGADATFKTDVPVKPNSGFVAKARANASTGAITISLSVTNPGTLSWLGTFANGKFGVFSARVAKCKRGYVELAGKCRPVTIVYTKGSKGVSGAGTLTVTLKPTASARRALATARKRHKGLPVTVKLMFQSSLGGLPTSVTITLTIKPKK